MANLKLGVQGILFFVVGILITIFGWYLAPALADLLPITSLKTIYWIGIVIYWGLAVVLLVLN